jgi:hypothetical protein
MDKNWKRNERDIAKFGGGDQCYKFTKANDESLPRAIIEACVEALDD